MSSLAHTDLEARLPRPDIEGTEQSVLPIGFGPTSVPPTVSLIIPALNEEASLGYVLARVPDGMHEVIVVDGRSTDNTVAVAKQLWPGVRIVTQEGRGKGDALRAGFRAAKGDIIIAIDADGSTNPAEIPAFVGALMAGADYVKGTRFSPGAGTSDMTFTRKVGNWGFIVLVRALFGVRYTDFNYGYTGFWRRYLPALDLRSTGFEIEAEMNLRAPMAGLKVVEVASFEDLRVAGEAHLKPLPDGWRVLMEVLRQFRRRLTQKEPAFESTGSHSTVAPPA